MYRLLFALLCCGLLSVTQAFAKPKGKPKKSLIPSTTRETVVSVSSDSLVTTRQKPSYTAKKVTFTEVIKTYQIDPHAMIQVNGRRTDAYGISEGMVVSVAADTRRSPDTGEEEYVARSIIASDPPKPTPTPTPPPKKRK